MVNKEDCIIFSGAAQGAEAEFGRCAELFGIDEVNFTFEGHEDDRKRGLRYLNHEELAKGDVSLAYISKILHRSFPQTDFFKKVLQSIWYQINSSQEVYVVGHILEDDTVKGGTGWGAEFAKLCNKPLYVFDQEKDKWFEWDGEKFVESIMPIISHPHFCGTGTRFIEENGKKAIYELFRRSFA